MLDCNHLLVGEVHVHADKDTELETKVTPSTLVLQRDLLLCFVHPTLPSRFAFDFADLVRGCQVKKFTIYQMHCDRFLLLRKKQKR